MLIVFLRSVIVIHYLTIHVLLQTTIPTLSLSKLAQYSLKHLPACPDDSKQQLLIGLLEHFFPLGGAHNQEDVSWLLEQLVLNTVFSDQPAIVRSLKLYLSRILRTVSNPSDSNDSVNPMDLFDDKASIYL